MPRPVHAIAMLAFHRETVTLLKRHHLPLIKTPLSNP